MIKRETQIGIQSSVMAWDDPWHNEECKHLLRTGEGKWFPSQDITPSKEELFSFITSLGVDFYAHSVMPNEQGINQFIDDIGDTKLGIMLNNEFGDINGPHTELSNRYDVPEACVRKAAEKGNLIGLIYDETEHLQMHPDMYKNSDYRKKGTRHQWTFPEEKSLDQIEADIVAAIRKQVEIYGKEIPMFSEQVFPVMYHTLARGGLHPCPKVLKEEFQSLQLSTALGAAKQYKRQMGICVDLWGPDVGPWFTRMWGFPGHSPREYQSALELAYLMGPTMMFTENIDVLAVHNQRGFEKTEYGDIFVEFIKKFVPAHVRGYNHSDALADIVVIRSDDGEICTELTGFGTNLYGGNAKRDYKTQSPFQVFHLLSRGRIPANGVTFFLPQFEYPASRYGRTEETLKKLPLRNGVSSNEATAVHPLFYPLHNVLVFDEHATGQTIGNPKLIFLAGSRITYTCLKAVEEKVRGGALCIAAEWLLPEGQRQSRRDGQGEWIVVNDFLNLEVKEAIEPYIGYEDCWMQRFGSNEVRFYNDNRDGITLSHEIIRLG